MNTNYLSYCFEDFIIPVIFIIKSLHKQPILVHTSELFKSTTQLTIICLLDFNEYGSSK